MSANANANVNVNWPVSYRDRAEVTIVSYPSPLTGLLRSVAHGRVASPVEKFRRLRHGWDGRRGVPPNPSAISIAEEVLQKSAELGIPYDRVVAIPDGGLAVYFFGNALASNGAHRLVARLAIDNDGSFTFSVEDIEKSESAITDETPDELDDIFDRIKAHISG